MLRIVILVMCAFMFITVHASDDQSASYHVVTTAQELIDAIDSANADADADTIVLQRDIRLDVTNNDTAGANGLPLIMSDITIEGQNYRIHRMNQALPFRILYVATGGVLHLQRVRIEGGATGDEGDLYERGGGGIFNAGGTVTLFQTAIAKNQARYGGGLFNLEGYISLQDSSIVDNVALLTAAEADDPFERADGGGIYNLMGSVESDNTTFSGNEAMLFAGGFINIGGTVTIRGGDISHNQAHDGGGFVGLSGLTRILSARIEENQATFSGGGFYSSVVLEDGTENGRRVGIVEVRDSSIYGNKAVEGGGFNTGLGYVDVRDTVFAANEAFRQGAGFKVALGGQAMATRITMRDNTARQYGGAIAMEGGNLTISNALLFQNRAANGAGLFVSGRFIADNITVISNVATERAGGIMHGDYGTGPYILHNSIIANNEAPDLPNCLGELLSGSTSLSDDPTTDGCPSSVFAPFDAARYVNLPYVVEWLDVGDLLAADGNNPAIDGAIDCDLAVDNLGRRRNRCDIGAFEMQHPWFVLSAEPNTLDEADAGQSVVVTIKPHNVTTPIVTTPIALQVAFGGTASSDDYILSDLTDGVTDRISVFGRVLTVVFEDDMSQSFRLIIVDDDLAEWDEYLNLTVSTTDSPQSAKRTVVEIIGNRPQTIMFLDDEPDE